MTRARFVPALLSLALASPSAGCFWVTTKHEGQELRRDVTQLETKVASQEEALGGSVQKLEATLEEASKLLARNSADLGLEVEKLTQENARLTGLVMEAKRYTEEVAQKLANYEERIGALETRLAALEGGAAAKSKSADDLYAEGVAAYKAKNYAEARESFRALVVRYPGHGRADDAQFYRGEAYFREGNFEASLKEFQAVFEKFASSALADDALYRAGQAAEKLKWCTDARAYYGLLRQKFPRSDLAKKSKTRDNALRRAAKNKKVCQS